MAPKKKGKRKRNKLGLFIGTLCAVLACGTVILVLLGAQIGNLGENLESKVEEWVEQLSSTKENGKKNTEETASKRWEQLEFSSKNDEGEERAESPSAETSRYGDILSNPERMKEEHIYIRDAVTSDEITLLFAGDILFDDGYSPMAHLRARNTGIAGVSHRICCN